MAVFGFVGGGSHRIGFAEFLEKYKKHFEANVCLGGCPRIEVVARKVVRVIFFHDLRQILGIYLPRSRIPHL